jgi:hypothetical protein
VSVDDEIEPTSSRMDGPFSCCSRSTDGWSNGSDRGYPRRFRRHERTEPESSRSRLDGNCERSVLADTGAITVSIELQAPTGFGVLRLDPSGTTVGLTNCVESGAAVACDWDGLAPNSPQTLAVFLDVDVSAAPGTGGNLAAIVTSAIIPDTDVYANANIATNPLIGTTSLSGTVITEEAVPVESACIFVLSSPLFVYQAITDSSGNWVINDLPDTYSFVVAAVPPFVGTFGPCANNGPPPIPGPGDLQPVFFDDIWIDLSDPALTGGLGEPYVFAVNAGATVLTSSTAGIDSCLTTAPPEATPRPLCTARVTTTTTTTPGSTTTTAPDVGAGGPTTTTPGTLPFTGINPTFLFVCGSLLIVLGAEILMGLRRSRAARNL